MKTVLIGCLSSLILLAFSSPTQAQRAILVVRHAEKETDPAKLLDVKNDLQTPLSEAGRARAEELARLLKDAGVDAIYTSPALRTQLTAEPLSKALSIVPKPLGRDSLDRLGELHKNDVVLIVGHSNTVPQIVDKLMKKPMGLKLRDDEFDLLITLVPEPDGGCVLVPSRFGAAPPAR